jgi:hypothetical protein
LHIYAIALFTIVASLCFNCNVTIEDRIGNFQIPQTLRNFYFTFLQLESKEKKVDAY